MNTVIINLADEGIIYEKKVHNEIFICDLSKMFKTMNIHFKSPCSRMVYIKIS